VFTNASLKFRTWLQAPCKHACSRFKKGGDQHENVLTPEASRALAEAEERRRQADEAAKANPVAKEIGGTSGPDPTRYGDWENKGIASDF
jgi:hypothetical protein